MGVGDVASSTVTEMPAMLSSIFRCCFIFGQSDDFASDWMLIIE
jgi:hypothetical protein